MKYKWIIASIILIAIVYFLPIPVSQSHTVSVDLSFDKLLYQVNDLKHWKAWWPDSTSQTIGDTVFKTSSSTYVLKRKDPLRITLSQDNNSILNFISVEPNGDNSTAILRWKQVSYIKTAINQKFKLLIGKERHSIDELLKQIKDHVEDPVKYYGFNIRIEPVIDTFVLVKRQQCLKENIPSCLRELFASLQGQLDKAYYRGRAEKMFFVDSSRTDSIVIIAGISIERRLDILSPFEIKTMPKAHIVVGDYEGDYKHIDLIHKAMVRYMSDHHISAVAVPYEKINVIPQTRQDSLHVKVKVYYPPYLP
jgi:effector-binding domain-containing protein